jgi:hypothetical protein
MTRVLGVACAGLMLAGCPGTVPLAEPEPGTLDDRIVGTWVVDTQGERNVFTDPDCTARFARFNAVEYLYSVRNCDALLDADARVYFTRVEDALFINVKWVSPEGGWSIYHIHFTDDGIELRPVIASAGTSEELRAKVTAGLRSAEIFGRERYLLRRAPPAR